MDGYDGYDCYGYDAVRIYAVIDATEEMIGSYCNEENPLKEAILSKGNALKIHFTSNYKNPVGKGFKIMYSSVEPGNRLTLFGLYLF